jgi:chorismate--pyruvate lyase
MKLAHWHTHVNALQAPTGMRDWLTDRSSLTVKLMAHSRFFRVQRLRQGPALCLADELVPLQMARRVRVQAREVILRCDGVPVVYAHTVVPETASASDWPFFSTLGDRSLGTTLFGDPLVRRSALEFARLDAAHPLALRARAAMGMAPKNWYARRRLFRRKHGVLLVTEVFSPAVPALRMIASVGQMHSNAAVTQADMVGLAA